MLIAFTGMPCYYQQISWKYADQQVFIHLGQGTSDLTSNLTPKYNKIQRSNGIEYNVSDYGGFMAISSHAGQRLGLCLTYLCSVKWKRETFKIRRPFRWKCAPEAKKKKKKIVCAGHENSHWCSRDTTHTNRTLRQGTPTVVSTSSVSFPCVFSQNYN